MVKQTPILWTVVITLGALISSWGRTGATSSTTQLRFYNSTTQLPHNNRIAPRGTTVLLECRVTPHQQQTHYNCTCPHPPCDGEYRKVYNNLILIVATPTTSGRYKCTPTPGGSEASATLTVQASLAQGTLALYNRSKLLLQNTLITDPQQIPNGLVCTTGRDGGARFRFEDGTTIHGRRQGQSTTVQSSQLNQNGRYVCFHGRKERHFHIYVNNATLPKPQVSTVNTANDQQLRLVLTRPEGYNSGRFILRYDCGFRGIPIELEYKSVEINGGGSDVMERRSRSCFVVGEISRVTVWFISGGHISSIPAVVNATSGEAMDSIAAASPPTTVPLATNILSAGPGVVTTNVKPTMSDLTSDQEPEDNKRSDLTDIHISANNQTTDSGQKTNSESISVQGNNPSSDSQTNNLIPLIGGTTGGVILLLVGVLVLIICTIGLVRRRGKRNRTTHYEHSLYYSTVQEGEQQAHNNTPPPVELQIDNFNTGGFYDEVEVKLQPTQVTVPPEHQLVDDAGDVVKVQQGDSERKDTAVANPEDLYAQPDKKSNKNKLKEQSDGEKQKEEVQNPELLYAVVDKPKKKKGKNKKTKEKDDLEQQQGELLYAEVNKPKKKGKKDKKGKVQKEEIPQNENEAIPPDTPTDTGLTYEPSADTDDTQQQHGGEVNTTQPTPSANAEGLYAEVDKTQKKQENK